MVNSIRYRREAVCPGLRCAHLRTSRVFTTGQWSLAGARTLHYPCLHVIAGDICASATPVQRPVAILADEMPDPGSNEVIRELRKCRGKAVLGHRGNPFYSFQAVAREAEMREQAGKDFPAGEHFRIDQQTGMASAGCSAGCRCGQGRALTGSAAPGPVGASTPAWPGRPVRIPAARDRTPGREYRRCAG